MCLFGRRASLFLIVLLVVNLSIPINLFKSYAYGLEEIENQLVTDNGKEDLNESTSEHLSQDSEVYNLEELEEENQPDEKNADVKEGEENISEIIGGLSVSNDREKTIINSPKALFEDTVVGDLYIENGSLNLNGHKLIVEGNVIHSRGTLNINGGQLLIGGDYRAQNESVNAQGQVTYGEAYYAYIVMNNDDDYIFIEGSFITQGYDYSQANRLIAGILEVKGDFTQLRNRSGYDEFIASGSHKTVLSGEALQTVSMEKSGSRFNILEIKNNSQQGIEFKQALNAATFIDNGCIVKFPGEEVIGWKLTENREYEKDLYLGGGVLDLNGKELIVKGNLIQSGGTIDINGGKLYIKGDYKIQTEIKDDVGNKGYGYSNGYLKMTTEDGYVKVEGDFITQSQQSHEGYLTKGTLEVKGDFVQKKHTSDGNFRSTGNHRVLLSGEKKQKVSFDSSTSANSIINILEITNTSQDGIEVTSKLVIGGEVKTVSKITGSKLIYLGVTAKITWDEWLYDLSIEENRTLAKDVVIKGNLYLHNGTLDLKGYKLSVGGNLIHSRGTLNINGGQLFIDEDYRTQIESVNAQGQVTYGETYYAYLIMNNSNDHILVGGNFVIQCYDYYRYNSLTAGILEVQGDFIQLRNISSYDEFIASGSHKTVLSGEGLQTVNIERPGSRFNILEIKNKSDQGVEFKQALNAATFIDNGCIVKFPGEEVIGWRLTENKEYEKDLYLGGGVLDLNGKELIVKGNLIQSGGTIDINGGKLYIEGDYKIQTERKDDVGNKSYGYSNGYLKMTTEDGYVKVEGDFITQSQHSHGGYLTEGTLEVKGDFIQKKHTSDGNFRSTGNHRVLLSGEKKQKVSFDSSTSSNSIINILEITNTSQDGIEVTSKLVIGGEVQTLSKITGSKLIYLGVTAKITWDEWLYDLSIEEDRTLLKDLNIKGNLYLDSGALNLKGCKLTVGGNLIFARGILNINGGKLFIGRDFRIQVENVNAQGQVTYADTYYAYLIMNNNNDHILVKGNFVMQCYDYYRYNSLTAGILEVQGDFIQLRHISTYDEFIASGSHKTVLSGEGLQTVNMERPGSRFNVLEIKNNSEKGVEFKQALNARTFIDNGCIVKFPVEEVIGWKLTENKEYEKDLYLGGGVLDLNGKELIVKGNLIQSGGTIDINGGKLYIEGDYKIQTEIKDGVGNKSYGYSNGYLKMTTEDGYVKVEGDFITQSQHSHGGYLTEGTLEVKGDFIQKKHTSDGNFRSTGNHRVLLSGEKKQKVSFDSSTSANSIINILEITNTSQEGIEVTSKLVIGGEVESVSKITGSKFIYLGVTAKVTFDEWLYDLSIEDNRTLSKDVVIKGNLYLHNGTLDLNGYKLTVGGSVIHSRGTLNINEGKLLIGGDYRMQVENVNAQGQVTYEDTYYANIVMSKSTDYVLVEGNFITQGYQYSQYNRLTEGVLEVKGDFTQLRNRSGFDEFIASGSHKTVLSGEGLQTVYMERPESRFNVLELKNNSEQGVEFKQALNARTFIDNGCIIKFPGEEQLTGWKLSGDEDYNGNLYLGAGVLDLDGNTLTIYGDLIQSGGTIDINGGKLIVKGSYRIQTEIPINDHEKMYIYSNGYLKMTQESDYVKVEGDFITQSQHDHNGYITEGVLEVWGDLIQKRHTSIGNFRSTANNKVVLSGSKLQKVSFETSSNSASCINILEMNNSSKEGIEFTSKVVVIGKIGEPLSMISGGVNLHIGDNAEANFNDWPSGLSIDGNYKLKNDMIIKGSLYLQGGTLNLNGFNLRVEENLVQSAGTMNINGGQLFVNGDYRIQSINLEPDGTFRYGHSSGFLVMTNQDDYIRVGKSFITQSYYNHINYLTAGILEIKGNFSQMQGNVWNFVATQNHRTILSGRQLQRVTFDDPSNSRFNELVITKPFNEGYVFNSTPVWNKLIEEIVDIEKPTIPQNLTVTRTTITTVTLKWDESKDNVGVLGYEIYRNGDRVGSSRILSFTDQGLVPYTQYTYTVKAYDLARNFSDESEKISVTTDIDKEPPSTPLNLAISSRGSDFVSLSWSASVDNARVAGYRIYRNEIHIADSANTRYTDSNVEPGLYSYTIKAYDVSNNLSDRSSEIVYDNKPPTVPENISAHSITATSVIIKWSESTDNVGVSSYEVYRGDNRVGITQELFYMDTFLEPESLYTYSIKAKDLSGNLSDPSDTITIETIIDEESPSIPIDLKVLSKTGSSITLTWKASVDNVAVKGYEIYRDNKSIGTTTTLSFKDVNLIEGIAYTYKVKAIDAAKNYSDFSNQISVTPIMPKIISVNPLDEERIGGAVNKGMEVYFLDSGNMTGSRATFEYSIDGTTWIPFETITYGPYRIQRIDENWLYFISHWNLSPLSSGNYMVRYTVYDADGNNDSRIVNYIVDRTPPIKVENFNGSANSSGVVLSWDVAYDGDVSHYNIYRSLNKEGTFNLLSKVSGRFTVSYIDKDISPDTTYYYHIRAVDLFNQEGDYSNTIEVTTSEDIVSPKILGISPANDTKLGTSAKIIVRAEDNIQVSSITLQYSIDSEESWIDVETINTTEVATFEWNNIPASEEIRVRAIAKDSSGNISDGTPVRKYYIDNEGPQKVTGLNATSYITNITLRWDDVKDDDFAYFLVEQKDLQNDSYKSVGTVNDTLGMNITDLVPQTTYYFRVVAYDIYGNKGDYSDQIEVSTKKDTVSPVITSLAPSPGYYSKMIQLKGSASDNVGVTSFVFQISYDMENWEDIETIELSNSPKNGNVTYNFDISQYPDGTYYIRGVACDAEGNSSQSNYFVEYCIDHTPPIAPEGLKVTTTQGDITIEWNRGREIDIKYYRVFKSNDSEGPYTLLADKLYALGYTDRHVEMGKNYYYKVSVVDGAGNESEKSDYVEAKLQEDTKAPEIISISPEDKFILPANPTIRILAFDNYKLARVTLEYNKGEDWILIGSEELDVYSKVVSFKWDTTELINGLYNIRVKAFDSSGNESEYYTVSYELKVEPPKTPEVTVVPLDWKVDVSWTMEDETDLAGFYVYRTNVSGGVLRRITALKEKSFTDGPLRPGQSYYYVVEAVDIYGNISRSVEVSCIPLDNDPYAPVANGGEDKYVIVGMEIFFDGRGSSDNDRIERYLWDFGDGTTGKGAQPSHTYTEEGVYEVKLTVIDPSGNSDTDTIMVTVYAPRDVGVLEVRVIDDSTGAPVAGASVYVDFQDDTPSRFTTDSQGKVYVVGDVGSFNIAAYAEGYLPNEIKAQLRQHQSDPSTIRIKKGELVVGDLNVRRMTLDEIIDAGIDINAPENQFIYEFEVTLVFEKVPLPTFTITTNGLGHIIGGWSGGSIRTPGGEIAVTTGFIPYKNPEVAPTLAYLVIPGEVKWLKEFFEVSLTMKNMAAPQFVIEDATVVLNIPEGLSLATTKDDQKLMIEMGSIAGGETKETKWIIRGDKKGSYNLEADFKGTLLPFNDPVSAKFKTKDPLVVLEGDAMHLNIMAQSAAYIGEEYYVFFQLKNTSDFPIYNLHFEVDGKAADVPKYHVITKENIESNMIHAIKSGDIIEVPILMPGESVWFDYVTIIDFEGDPSRYYYVLRKTYLEQRGSIIPTTITTIPSHIYKYRLITNSGQNVHVITERKDISLIIDRIKQPGNTFVTVHDNKQIKKINNINILPLYYGVTTSAEVSGKSQVKINYDITGYEQFKNNLRLYNIKDGKAVDITENITYGTQDNTNIITFEGTVEDLCYFAVGYQEPRPKSLLEVSIVGDGSVIINDDENLPPNYKASYEYGSKIKLTAIPGEGLTFVYWEDAKLGRIVSTDSVYDFIMGSEKNIKAVFYKVNIEESVEFNVVFKDRSGRILQSTKVEKNSSAVPPQNPYMSGYEFAGWDKDFSNVVSDMIISPIFIRLPIKYTITVEGGKLSNGDITGEYQFDMQVKVIADEGMEGKSFSHWEQDGIRISSDKVFSFFMPKRNTLMKAVFVGDNTEIDNTPFISLSEDVIINSIDSSMIFTANRNITQVYKLIESGIIILKSDSELEDMLNLETENILRGRINNNSTNQFYVRKLNIEKGETWFARAYLIYEDSDGNIKTEYSQITAKGVMPL